MSMQHDRQFKVVGKWALASDGLQWVLQYQSGSQWNTVSFVRSTKDILARCMKEKGCEAVIAKELLDGLPDRFDDWKRHDTG
jgi:hypothetical protein